MTSEEPTTTEAPATETPEAPATETETTTVVHETEKPADPVADEAAAAHEESRSNEEKSAAKSAVEENAAAQFAEAEKPVTDQKSE